MQTSDFGGDLSKKQLETLKELYIQKKVESMSHQELKQYVLEIISHQINDTIGKEEEMEAWREMSDFFGEQFEIIILEIQTKYIEDKNVIVVVSSIDTICISLNHESDAFFIANRIYNFHFFKTIGY